MDENLKIVSSAKDLGITVSKDLKWTAHIAQIVAKSNRMLGFLKKNHSGDLRKDSLELLYNSLVRSNLCCASQLWAPQSPIFMLEVQNIQRRATCFICKNSELSYRDKLLNLNLLPINYWLEYLDLSFFYKCIYGLIDINLDNLDQFCSGRSRRRSSELFLNNKTANTYLFRNSFFIRITDLWNALPIAIRSEIEIVPFKKKVKSSFL